MVILQQRRRLGLLPNFGVLREQIIGCHSCVRVFNPRLVRFVRSRFHLAPAALVTCNERGRAVAGGQLGRQLEPLYVLESVKLVLQVLLIALLLLLLLLDELFLVVIINKLFDGSVVTNGWFAIFLLVKRLLFEFNEILVLVLV